MILVKPQRVTRAIHLNCITTSETINYTFNEIIAAVDHDYAMNRADLIISIKAKEVIMSNCEEPITRKSYSLANEGKAQQFAEMPSDTDDAIVLTILNICKKIRIG